MAAPKWSPGPSDYSPRMAKLSPRWTISRKLQPPEPAVGPGPAPEPVFETGAKQANASGSSSVSFTEARLHTQRKLWSYQGAAAIYGASRSSLDAPGPGEYFEGCLGDYEKQAISFPAGGRLGDSARWTLTGRPRPEAFGKPPGHLGQGPAAHDLRERGLTYNAPFGPACPDGTFFGIPGGGTPKVRPSPLQELVCADTRLNAAPGPEYAPATDRMGREALAGSATGRYAEPTTPRPRPAPHAAAAAVALAAAAEREARVARMRERAAQQQAKAAGLAPFGRSEGRFQTGIETGRL